MRINTNIMAINTHRQLGVNNSSQSKITEKLSSGLKINRAADDAAGLTISEKMRAQMRGLSRASANAQDGVSLIQAAEGALQETHSILQRMRELAVQAANDVNETEDRDAIQSEINQLASEVDRIAYTTEFNKKTLLDGSLEGGKKYGMFTSGAGVQNVQIKDAAVVDDYYLVTIATAAEKYEIEFEFKDYAGSASFSIEAKGGIKGSLVQDSSTASALFSGSATFATFTGKTSGRAMASETARNLNKNSLFSQYYEAIADGNKLTIRAKEGFTVGASGFNISICGQSDTKITSSVISSGVSAVVKVSTGAGAGAVVTAGTDGTYVTGNISFRLADPYSKSKGMVTVGEGRDLTLQVGANTGTTQTIQVSVEALTAKRLGVSNLKVDDHRNSQAAIDNIERAITQVSKQRSTLGAVQNRLEHTIANLDTVNENLTAAESRIRDMDMAKGMMDFTKTNILTQAATAMLAQANSAPQTVLQLLQ